VKKSFLLLPAILLVGFSCSRRAPEKTEITVPEAPDSAESPPAGLPANQAPPPAASASAAGNDCEHLPAPPASAEKLCDEHVMATGAEIHWQSYVSRDSRLDVNRPYQEWASRCHAGLVTKPPIFSVTQGQTRLSTHEPATADFPTCNKSPSPEHKTVIVYSTKVDH
jgi:hypothetical protein